LEGTSLISQRKIAVSFRHSALLNIFTVSLQVLNHTPRTLHLKPYTLNPTP